jgi:DNA-binding transcriptional MocR family regulator
MQNHPIAQGVTNNPISLLLGYPDPSTLFTPQFQDALQRVLTSAQPFQPLQYGPEQGTPALIDYLVEKFNHEQPYPVSADQVMIVAGSTHAVVELVGASVPENFYNVDADTFTTTSSEVSAIPVEIRVFLEHPGVALDSGQ